MLFIPSAFFCDADKKMEGYYLVVVGNKIDLASSSTGSAVPEGPVFDIIGELVPLSGSPSSSLVTPGDEPDWIPRKDLTTSPADPTMGSLRVIASP